MFAYFRRLRQNLRTNEVVHQFPDLQVVGAEIPAVDRGDSFRIDSRGKETQGRMPSPTTYELKHVGP